MNQNNKRLNLGKVYFLYLFFVLFLQIIGADGKNETLELVWKAAVISCTLFYILYKKDWKVVRSLIAPCFIYLLGQIFAYISFAGASVGMFVNCAVVIGMSYMFISLTAAGSGFELEDMMWFIKAFTALMLYAVIYQFVVDSQAVLGALNQENVYSDMMSSFFDNKQTFGMFLFVAFIVSFLGLVMSKKKIYIVFSMLFFGMLFVCSSRTSLLACVVFVMMIPVLFLRINRKIAITVLTAIGVAVFAIWIVSPVRRFVLEVLLDTEATVVARENIWEGAFRAMQGSKILFGYGEGNVEKAITGIDKELIGNAHNGVIHVFVTGGVIKLVLYVVVVINSLRNIRGIYK